MFCAVNAARMSPLLQVTVLEKTTKLLSKVKVSGGGRCNVTHSVFDIGEMSSRYPRGQHFVRKAFHQFFTTDTIEWFASRGVKLKAEADGRMFPVTDSSQTVIDCLMREAATYGVEIRTKSEVRSLTYEGGAFHIETSDVGLLTADFVTLALGGYPKASMFDWLQSLEHTFSPPVPSLFTFNLPGHPITNLMGVSVPEAKVKIAGTKLIEHGPLLITHWGLSGPAALRLSAWGARQLSEKAYQFGVHINWTPRQSETELKISIANLRAQHPGKTLHNHGMGGLPSRLWTFLLQQSGIAEGQRFADLPAKQENALVRNLIDYVIDVKGKTTFKEEFVTSGGITLSEVEPSTMMSRKVQNLYFAGEVLDVDGITGGFNFQHAWTSGWIAAKAIAQAATD